jgi:hypothetical protein
MDDLALFESLRPNDSALSDADRAALRASLFAGFEGGDGDDPGHFRDPLAGNWTVTLIDTEPAPIQPEHRHLWPLIAAAAAATVAVIAGGLVLAARDDDTGGASDQLLADEGGGTRVGFIGLPHEGATPSPSPPPTHGPVVSISPCYAPIADPSETDTLPPLGALLVFDEGGDQRLIWQKFENLPEGANSRSTGLLEQRLTLEGVELMRSEAIAAFNSGEINPDDCRGMADLGYFVTAYPFDGERAISADNEHLARMIDPWSWLPASAWADPEIRPYVPSTYQVAFEVVGESVDAWNNQLVDGFPAGDTHLSAALPAAAVDLIDTKAWKCFCGGNHMTISATFTIDEARAFAAALDEAGLEKDGLLNAYRLDYEFEYPNETLDVPMHIWFYANHPYCELPVMDRSCNWSYPMLKTPDDIAAPDGTASPDTTAAVGTTAPDDTPVAD